MSQSGALTLSGGGGGVVTSVTGANGVTASPTTGAVVVSGINATTSSVGVARFNPAQFSITAGAVSLIGASTLAIQTINSLPPNAAANFTINTSNTNIQFVAGGNTITWNGNPANNLLYVDLSDIKDRNGIIKLQDYLGRIIIEKKFNDLDSLLKLNVSGLSSGLYFYSIQIISRLIKGKIVVN